MTETTSKSPRWMRFALIGSLALNLLIIGVIVGTSFRGERHVKDHDPSPGDLRALAHAMPEHPRAALRGFLNDRGNRLRDGQERVIKGRRRLIEALEAEPFDAEAMRDIFAHQREALLAIADEGRSILIETIEGMTVEERKRFASNLSNYRRPRRK